MILAPVKQQRLGEILEFTIDAGAEALLVKLIEQVFELTLAAAHNRRHHGDALALSELKNALNDLVGGLPRDGPAAIGAVGRAHRCIEQAQVIVNLSNGADGGTRAAAGGFLLDGDGRAQSFNGVDVRPFDLVKKLARVCRKRFNVAALPLGINGVERKRAFAGAGEAGDHRERVARDAHVDVAQIMLARPAHRNVSNCHDG